MGRLSASLLTAIESGAPTKQVFKRIVPTNSLHLAYTTFTFDEGAFADGSLRVVTRAGSRTHEVWNPHPMAAPSPAALRWTFECSNADGVCHPGHAASLWSNGAYSAKPQQCYIQHELWVKTASGWTEVTDVRFYGRVIDVSYSMTAAPDKSVRPAVAAITVEQAGAWEHLRRPWTENDGVRSLVYDGTSGPMGF